MRKAHGIFWPQYETVICLTSLMRGMCLDLEAAQHVSDQGIELYAEHVLRRLIGGLPGADLDPTICALV